MLLCGWVRSDNLPKQTSVTYRYVTSSSMLSSRCDNIPNKRHKHIIIPHPTVCHLRVVATFLPLALGIVPCWQGRHQPTKPSHSCLILKTTCFQRCENVVLWLGKKCQFAKPNVTHIPLCHILQYVVFTLWQHSQQTSQTYHHRTSCSV